MATRVTTIQMDMNGNWLHRRDTKERPQQMVEEKSIQTIYAQIKQPTGSILCYMLNSSDINIYVQDNQRRTPLHHAIMRGCIKNAKKLIEKDKLIRKKSLLNLRDVQGALPIHYACRYGTKEMLNLFGDSFTQLFNEKTLDQKRPIDVAAEYGHLDIIEEFLPQVPVDDPKSNTALAYAAIRYKDKAIVSRLKDQLDPFPDDGILHAACRERYGHESISSLEVTEENLKRIGQDGLTPLMVAVKYRRCECVKALLQTGQCTANVFRVRSESFKRTVLHICAEVQYNKITDILFEALKNLNFRDILFLQDVMGNTSLHICAQKGNNHMCEKILNLYKTLPRSYPGNKAIWLVNNYNKLTAFQEAVKSNQLQVVQAMLTLVPHTDSRRKIIRATDDQRRTSSDTTESNDPRTMMICATDDQFRTNLHIAALKGNSEIVNLLINERLLDVNKPDMNDNTPLHNAVAWDNDNEEDTKDRLKCIQYLIKNEADINAYNIWRETPLHNASRYGSSKLVKFLLDHNADILVTDINGMNCLEVAIEEKNEPVVKYFIDHDQIFELMRNAQFPCGGNENNKSDSWVDTPMRKLIVNMPDMAFLVLEKFYSIFIGLFTAFAVRIEHPQHYYSITNINFTNKLCANVSNAIKKQSPDDSGMKGLWDYLLKYSLYGFLILLLAKHVWIFWSFVKISITKPFVFIFEYGAILLCFLFISDHDYQENFKMRCPVQWQLGAFGLFIGYLGLLYYIQYIPIIGIYVIMLKIIIVRFIFFLPVLTCLSIGFGLAFYMLLQYSDKFDSFAPRVLSQMVIMMTGELNFSDNTTSDDDPALPYYKLIYIMYVLFAIGVVILVANLLISLAVAEIVPLMNKARGAQIDMKFELIADYEILRLRLYIICCHLFAHRSKLFEYRNMNSIPWWEKCYKRIVDFFTHTTYIDEDMFESINEAEDKTDSAKQMRMLGEIKDELKKQDELKKIGKQPTTNKVTKSNHRP
ncbi:unnamed protein product [Adineta steineri]|uniref:Uncharacterized protein n=1 Tax=Adineta steineri TaxID=433720 RepID=A0A819GEN1_9BILA|nr:unnamed protein product [Adineta steineri]CAF3884605.1 unnamed protein product [Adineta steineri]